MNTKVLFVGLIIAGLLQGCTSYKHKTPLLPSPLLDTNRGVFISRPKNGWYGDAVYRNSGITTAQEVKSAFSLHANPVVIIPDLSLKEFKKKTYDDVYGYFVRPSILHWEERATEWSGKPDRIEVLIQVYDAGSKEMVAQSSFSGKSKWLTFGGDHPQDLLPKPINQIVESWYQGTE